MVNFAVDLLFSESDIYMHGKIPKERYITEIALGLNALFTVDSYIKSGAVSSLSV